MMYVYNISRNVIMVIIIADDNLSKQQMRQILMMMQPQVPEFRHLKISHIPGQLVVKYSNPVYLTPRYQKISYTQDMLKYIRYLQRSSSVSYDDMKVFVQHLLTQYHTLMKEDRPKANIIMEKAKIIPKNAACYFHGEVDWMYSANGFNMTPIMFFRNQINPAAGIGMAISNMHIRMAMAKAAMQQLSNNDKKYQHANSYETNNVKGYALLTTGHMWQMIRVDKYMNLQKSIILQGRNQYKTIYNDQQMISIVLGMIDYCLELPQINVRVLDKAYQYLDERRYMVEGENDAQANKGSWLSKLLLAYHKKKM